MAPAQAVARVVSTSNSPSPTPARSNELFFASLSRTSPPHLRQPFSNTNGQDTWRIKPNLTLTFGLRHSFFRQPTDASGAGGSSRLVNFDPVSGIQRKRLVLLRQETLMCRWSTMFPTPAPATPNYNPLNGLIFADPPTFNGFVGTKSPFGKQGWKGVQQSNCAAPRDCLGSVWQRQDLHSRGLRNVLDNGLEFGNPNSTSASARVFLTNLNVNRTTLSDPPAALRRCQTRPPFTIQPECP